MADTITDQPVSALDLNERAPVRPARTHKSKNPIPPPRLERKEESYLCRLICCRCIDDIDRARESDHGPIISEDTGCMHVAGDDRYIDDLDYNGRSYRLHGDDSSTPMGHDVHTDAPVYIDRAESHQTSNSCGHHVNVDHRDESGGSFHESAKKFCDSSDVTGGAHHGVSDTGGAGHYDSGGADRGGYCGADDTGGGGGGDSGGGVCDSGGGGGDSGGGGGDSSGGGCDSGGGGGDSGGGGCDSGAGGGDSGGGGGDSGGGGGGCDD